MPRCFKPSLTRELLNTKLAAYNAALLPIFTPHGTRILSFDTSQTIKASDAIRVQFDGVVYSITINETTGEPVVPAGALVAQLVRKFGDRNESVRDFIFQRTSDRDGTGCGPVAGAAVGGAGGPAAFAPSSLLTRSPGASPGEDPSMAAAAHSAASSPGFDFGGGTPPNPGERKSRRRNRKTRRSTRRKTRRYRTKQNRY
jgi:hypothetical protein